MTTAAQRIQIQHSAEQEIMRYARSEMPRWWMRWSFPATKWT